MKSHCDAQNRSKKTIETLSRKIKTSYRSSSCVGLFVLGLITQLLNGANGPISKQVERVGSDTLDFIQVPGYPSAIRVFALTHSRRNVVQRLPWFISFALGLIR